MWQSLSFSNQLIVFMKKTVILFFLCLMFRVFFSYLYALLDHLNMIVLDKYKNKSLNAWTCLKNLQFVFYTPYEHPYNCFERI